MKDNVPLWGAAATPGPEPPSASSGLDTTLDELRQILQLTAELRAGSRSTSPTEGRGQARTSALRPTDPPSDLPCPPGMPRATYRRLLKRHDRSSRKLTALASRRLLPHVRKRLDSQFRNALRRVRRALGLPEWEPGRRTWYSLSAAAISGSLPARCCGGTWPALSRVAGPPVGIVVSTIVTSCGCGPQAGPRVSPLGEAWSGRRETGRPPRTECALPLPRCRGAREQRPEHGPA